MIIHLEATENEVVSLAGLIDGAVKGLGLRAVSDAKTWMDKIEASVILAKNKKEQEDKDKLDQISKDLIKSSAAE